MLGDYGGGDNAFSSLWEALPSVAVVGGQVRLSSLSNPLSIFMEIVSLRTYDQDFPETKCVKNCEKKLTKKKWLGCKIFHEI